MELEQLIDLLFSSIPTSNDRGEKEAYRALLRDQLRLYAAQERARCEQAVRETRYPQAPGDEWRGAMLMRDYCADAICSLD